MFSLKISADGMCHPVRASVRLPPTTQELATVDRKRRRFSAEVEQHEVVAVDSCLEQVDMLRGYICEHVGQQLGRSTSTPIVAVGGRELDAVGGTDGRQHDVGVSLQSVVVADKVVVDVTRVTEVVVRPPVLVGVRRHVQRVDDVPHELAECYATALTHRHQHHHHVGVLSCRNKYLAPTRTVAHDTLSLIHI